MRKKQGPVGDKPLRSTSIGMALRVEGEVSIRHPRGHIHRLQRGGDEFQQLIGRGIRVEDVDVIGISERARMLHVKGGHELNDAVGEHETPPPGPLPKALERGKKADSPTASKITFPPYVSFSLR